eukprot:15431590-Alexandrium_andersonii.AAC.1
MAAQATAEGSSAARSFVSSELALRRSSTLEGETKQLGATTRGAVMAARQLPRAATQPKRRQTETPSSQLGAGRRVKGGDLPRLPRAAGPFGAADGGRSQ